MLKKAAVRHKIAKLKFHEYTTIVFKTDYDEKLEEYYKNNYRFFEKYLPNVKKNPDNGLLEKAEIKWFTFAELRKNRGKFREFYRNMVDIILEHEDAITRKLRRPVCGTRCSFNVTRSTATRHGKKSNRRNLTVKNRRVATRKRGARRH
jgi:hypothetical protein